MAKERAREERFAGLEPGPIRVASRLHHGSFHHGFCTRKVCEHLGHLTFRILLLMKMAVAHSGQRNEYSCKMLSSMEGWGVGLWTAPSSGFPCRVAPEDGGGVGGEGEGREEEGEEWVDGEAQEEGEEG